MSPEDTLLPLLSGVVEKAPGEWMALCPCHDDHSPSLSIKRTDRGGLVLYCHVCKDERIDRRVCDAVGIKLADICPPSGRPAAVTTKPVTDPVSTRGVAPMAEGGKLVETYIYRNADGSLNRLVARYESGVGDAREKTFRQYRPDGNGGWVAGVKGVPEVPYRLPQLLASSPDDIVFIVEGEKCAEALVGLGLVATCNAGGAGKWPKEFREHFYDRDVVVLPDNDKPGADHAYKVVRSLECRLINVVTLPGLGEREDCADWIARGGTRDELLRIVAENTNLRPQIPDHDEPSPVATAEAAASSRAWGELVPFDQLDLPEFPAEVLPGILRGWVRCVSVSTQTPLDLAALLGLATCSASIAKRVEVQVTPDWREPVNLYVAVELPPGNRKSAVFSEATGPLRALERDEANAAAPVIAVAQSERRRMQSRLNTLERKVDPGAAVEAAELAERLALTPEVVLPRRIVDEATPEFVGKVLADQGGRIASMSAEGGVFDVIAGMYSKSGAPNLNVFLQGHAGDDLVIDRLSRPSVRVQRPALTCGYAVQPQVIEALANNKVFRGRGLCGRFAFSSPRSWLGSRDVNPPAVPDGVRQAYWAIVQQLAQIEGEHVLTLSPEAAEDRLAWQSIVETMLAEGGDLEAVQDWGGKLVGLTVRLAGVMHCIEHDGPLGQITQQTFHGAVEIARYLIPHARHVLRRLAADDAGQAASDAEYVLRWIVRHERQTFSKRDLYQQTKNRFRKVEALAPVLAELIGRHFIRPVDVQAGGRGRPSEQYETNPAVFETPEKHPHSPQKSLGLRSGGVSGDFGDGSRETQNTNPVRSGGGL